MSNITELITTDAVVGRGNEAVAGRTVTVHFIGAGPGAAGLMTLAGRDALVAAEHVLHDRLVSAEVLALAGPDAVLEDVGKLPGEDHDATQRRICERLVTLARAGRRVVRLKGGDAFIFGRGGEELAWLAAHAVPYAVVPGITAALGCAAHAGIPLTHRGSSQHAIGYRQWLGASSHQSHHHWDRYHNPCGTTALATRVAPRVTDPDHPLAKAWQRAFHRASDQTDVQSPAHKRARHCKRRSHQNCASPERLDHLCLQAE